MLALRKNIKVKGCLNINDRICIILNFNNAELQKQRKDSALTTQSDMELFPGFI